MRKWLILGACCAVLVQDAAAQVPIGQPRQENAPDSVFAQAARTAWSFVAANTERRTGLVRALPAYPYVTTWDIGSTLGALFSAVELGLVSVPDYNRRMTRVLETLAKIGMVDSIAFNRNYRTRDGRMVDRRDRPTRQGWGWSATDLGRLLVWLHIVAVNHPQHADAARQVAERLDMGRLVRDGYLWGEERSSGREPRVFQEGRIGYEQYAASGFSLWGAEPTLALDLRANAVPDTVLGQPVLRDRRGMDRLTSEPFVMKGIELGWSDAERELATALLAAQQERYRQTGEVTIVSEDAVSIAPYYFYYYSVLANGEEFMVDVASHDQSLDSPRWVSTKMSFGWHALLPSEYTRLAVETVAPAHHAREGWSSGVFEKTHRPTYTRDLNTAAMILEAALYNKLKRPLVQLRDPD